MRFLLKITSLAAIALFLSWGSAAQAQVVFDGTDWVGDRGSTQFPVVPGSGGANNGDALRSGYNDFYTDPNLSNLPDPSNPKDHPLTNPGEAVPRWVWPFTRDLAQLNPFQQLFQPIIVDNEDLQGRLSGYAFGTADPLDPQEAANDKANPFYGYAFNNAADPARVSPLPRTNPPYAEPKTDVAGQNPTYPALNQQAYPQSRLLPINSNNTSPWTLPSINDNGNNDRAPGGGYSIGTDATKPYNYDYYYVFATHDDFVVNRGSNGNSPATAAELALLPNAPVNVYSAVHSELVKSSTNNNPISVWTSGGQAFQDTDPTSATYGLYVKPYVPGVRSDKSQTPPFYPYTMNAGHYEIDLYSPGDGTYVAGDTSGFPHGNVQRALVRVSWYKTVNANGSLNFGPGTPNSGGINDPVNSRIFIVDLSTNGWIPIQGGGLGPASINFDGNPNDQLTVTLYSLTPDDVTSKNPVYGNQAPLITADAVRFVPQLLPTYEPDPNNPGKRILVPPPAQLSRYTPNTTNPNNPILQWTITGYGRILAAAVGTNKFASLFTPNSTTLNPVEPVVYVAREEGRAETDLSNPPLRSFTDPTSTASAAAPDPTALSTMPVFYCLDNKDGDIVQTDANGNALFDTNNNPLYITSAQKVRWRYEGDADIQTAATKDSNGNLVYTSLGGATAVASPLLANVRCRDGKTRTMLYFMTTSGSGQLGHIYALDPIGNKDSTGTPDQSTNAFWIYPSYRPFLGNEPTAPPQFNDPNFTLPTGVTRPAGYPAPAVADNPVIINTLGNGNSAYYYDGDLVVGSDGALHVRADTQVHLGGVQGAPVIIEDPEYYQKNGMAYVAQLLVVPGSDGRLYTFDAGGRLDFGSVTNTAGTTFTAAGTTQRIWTWPHLGADTFHTTAADTSTGYTGGTPPADDPSKVNFLTSLAYDFNQPVGSSPVLATAGDGHLYGVFPGHDERVNDPLTPFAERVQWQFPSASTSLNPTGTYSASISTPAIFKNNVYFTCNGRAYSVAELPVNTITPPAINSLTWVYPYTNNIPYPIYNNASSDALNPGFNSTAPLVIAATNVVESPDKTLVPGAPPNGQSIPDTVYLTQGNGTMLALNAAPTGTHQTTNYAYGNTLLGGATNVSPIGSLITSQAGLDPSLINQNSSNPMLPRDNPVSIIGDEDGFLSAFGMLPTSDSYDTSGNPNGNYNVLPLLWTIQDTQQARTASAMLVGGDHFDFTNPIVTNPNTNGKVTGYHLPTSQNNPNLTLPLVPHGILVDGDNGGQVRAYGIGYGTTALGGGGSTTGPGEPTPLHFGPGLVSIDTRGIDFYTETDFNNMALSVVGNANKTPAQAPPGPGTPFGAGTNFANTATPLNKGLLPNNGVGVDWGDFLYVAVYGVYHAQVPKDISQGTYWGQTAPQITVNFTITQPGQGTRRYTFNVPNITPSRNPQGGAYTGLNAADPTYTNDFSTWPDDSGVLSAEAAGLQIEAIDANFPADSNNPQNPGPVKGYAAGTFPWVGKYRIHIRPDRNNNFAPGTTNYRVSAYATITQTYHDDTLAPTDQNYTISANSTPLSVGQRDPAGMSYRFYQRSPNIRRGPLSPNANGPTRPVYIGNPIALSIQGAIQPSISGSMISDGEIGWSPDIANVTSAAALNEILNNDNLLDTPGLTASTVGNNKELFAPIGMIQDGNVASYQVLNGNNASASPVPGIYVIDRSNLKRTTGRALQVQLAPTALKWLGGPSSVMNPLPWESLPTDVQTTTDYPAITPDNITSTFHFGGESGITAPATLQPPAYPDLTNDATRVPQLTQVDLNISVPKYQPANVNFGPTSFNGVNFGSAFVDLNGGTNGNAAPTLNGTKVNGVFGPMTISGDPLTSNTGGVAPILFPAGGYVATVGVVAYTGKPIPPWGSGPTSPGGANSQYTTREIQTGLTVAPRTQLKFQEAVLDLGNLPHGTGYSDRITGVNSGPPYYNSVATSGTAGQVKGVFQPSMPAANGTVTPTPWDNPDPTALYGGEFFQPFTLISDSNINLVDVRIAKLLGQPGTTPAWSSLLDMPPATVAAAARMTSDQVTSLSDLNLFGVPFFSTANGAGLGNIGFVSSFDHVSAISNPQNKSYLENYLVWAQGTTPGIANPYVTGAGISNAGLPTSGYSGWSAGIQPTPTIHKPGVGDATGTTATIPDKPRNYNAALLQSPVNFVQPKIGVAVPPGTPSGTYSAPVYAYEDNTPIQWRAWLTAQGLSTSNLGADHDNILNVSSAGSPLEAHTDPALILKAHVTEARLTNGVTTGTLTEIDPATGPAVAGSVPSTNMLPTAFRPVTYNNGVPVTDDLILYFTQNRGAGQSQTVAPFTLAYTYMPGVPQPEGTSGFYFDDVNFAVPSGTSQLPSLWSPPRLFPTVNDGVSLSQLFPSDTTTAASATSITNGVQPAIMPGSIVASTARFASAAAVQAINSSTNADTEAWLFWQGAVDKTGVVTASTNVQSTDSRTFYMPLNGQRVGTPGSTPTYYSILNDPALPKYGPKPLILKLASGKYSYVFYYSGSRGKTSLYYTVNYNKTVDATVPMNNWSPDVQLPSPTGLNWQSDPSPIFRQVPINGTMTDVIDVVYTGVLHNNQTSEVLLSRYIINEGQIAGLQPGALQLTTLEPVQQETLTRAGGTNTYGTRDVAWLLHTGDPKTAAYDNLQLTLIDTITGNQTPLLTTDNTGGTLRGKFDPASGLAYYNSALGGQIVVDPTSGTVSFPNIPPGRNQQLVATYMPQAMVLTTSRNDSNVLRPLSAALQNEPALAGTAGTPVVGNNSGPIAFLDRGPNTRAALTSPAVIFNATSAPPVDRMWVVYRKFDPSGGIKSSLFYKTMRLMVKLPSPVQLNAAPTNGVQTMNVAVANNQGPYEVDWVRGRIYFTSADEGNLVQVTYTAVNGKSYQQIPYRVAWGDEISATGGTTNTTTFSDITTPEVVLPTQSLANEGQVTAFKDPLQDKIWVFWASNRGVTSDLYYQTISPKFYPTAVNQQ